MKLEVQSITLQIKPSFESRNWLQRRIDALKLYCWLAINIATLLETTRHSTAVVNDVATVVSLQATIKPVKKTTKLEAIQ